MGKYIVKRILQVIPMLFILSLIVFMMVRLIPGDPVDMMLGMDIPKDTKEYERERLGLNDPLYIQYFRFVGNALHGDLGTSIFSGKPVVEELAKRFPKTLTLAVGGTLFGAAVGVLLGIIAAIHRNKFADNLIMVLSLLTVSTPSFFLALILMLIFCLNLRWLPSIGMDTWQGAILPIATLGLQAIGSIARTTRSAMLDVIHQDYIRTSRSRGVPERVITYRHAFKNALIPVLTTIGLRFGGLLAGATLVETVFSIPGIGRFVVDSVSNRDYPAIQGAVLVLAVTFVLVNTLVDLLYAAVDPRVKYGLRRNTADMKNKHPVLRRFMRRKVSVVAAAVLILFVLIAILGPLVWQVDPLKQSVMKKYGPMTVQHPLGTDNLGRDTLARMIYGARVSLAISFAGVLSGALIGVLLGVSAGYFGGWVDAIISRFIDILLAFPGLLLAITIVAVLGPGSVNTVIAITIFTIPGLTRMVRSVVLSLKSSEYVEACKTMGESNLRIILTHVIPNSMSQIIVNVTLSLGTAILTASSLSFLGLGVTPPEAEWGAMLSQMREVIRTYPTGVLVPGIAITLVVMSFSLVGDGLRDALDPKLKNN